MGRPKFTRREVEIRLRPEPAGRPRRLVPWWTRALRRVRISGSLRRQARGSLGRAQVWRDAGAELRAYARRSVVKASFSRNRKSGAWTAHARYLSRPGAQQELAKGLGFDATREGIDLQTTVRDWEKNDKLMWRFIVSPEDADRLNLSDHVRELVGQMERDLGTKLEWVAIDHRNTDEAHVHLLVRGVRADGRPLEIDREYLRSGIRTRSQEIVTRELGPRLEPEMLHARGRVIRREQWTEIDRGLQHRADANRVVSYANFQPRSEAARVRAEQEIERLQFLSGLGVARQIDERAWQLSQDHERQLRDRQRSIDVIKSRAHSRQRDIDSGFDRVRERERERNG
jgi:type IV secretory pathway VirD2 relaxase